MIDTAELQISGALQAPDCYDTEAIYRDAICASALLMQSMVQVEYHDQIPGFTPPLLSVAEATAFAKPAGHTETYPYITRLMHEGLGEELQETIWQKRHVLTNGALVYGPSIPNLEYGIKETSRPIYDKRIFEEGPVQVDFELTGECADEKVLVPSIQNLPDFMALKLFADGPLQPVRGSLRRDFDIRHNIMNAELTYADKSDHRFRVKLSQFLDYAEPERAVTRLQVIPEGNYAFTVRAGISSEKTPNAHRFTNIQRRPLPSDRAVTYHATTVSGQQVAFAQQAELSCPAGDIVAEHIVTPETTNDIWHEYDVAGQANQTYDLIMYSTVAVREREDAPMPDLTERAVGALRGAPNYNELLRRHLEAWEEQWSRFGVMIDGDPEYAQALMFAQSHAIAHAGWKGLHPRLEPKIGNDTEAGYGARDFWDGFVLAINALTLPQRRAMLAELSDYLPMARHKARAMGYKGAWLPWERFRPSKQPKHGEGCPEKMPTKNGIFVEVKTFSESIHISADVIYALDKYVEESGDDSILWERDGRGVETMLECAWFLADFATEDPPGSGEYHIVKATGADEFHESMKDNAFTVLMTKHALRRVLDLENVNDQVKQAELLRLRQAIGLDNTEWERLRKAYSGLKVPINEKTLVIPACEGWENLLTVNWEDPRIKGRRDLDTVMREIHERPEGVAVDHWNPVSWYKAVKQDDLMLALVLLQENALPLLDQSVVRPLVQQFGVKEAMRQIFAANYDEYVPITTAESSLSPGTTAIAAILSGQPLDVCYELARRSVLMDLDDSNPYGTHKGLHSAAAGNSVWLTRCFMGIRLSNHELTVDPHMPRQLRFTTSVEECFGHMAKVSINKPHRTVMVELLDRTPGSELWVNIRGQRVKLTAEYPIAFHDGKHLLPVPHTAPSAA